MSQIQIASQDVFDYSTQLKSLEQDVKSLFEEIKNKMTYIETVWNSPAGQALVEQFQSLNPVFESYVTALDQYALYLQQTAQSYQENEQMLTQGIG
ncbi:MAG: WXG100 family type VII secretion target [Erysipelotrichaceae bacterium]|nr:WXG100 family type VII secretion target [Erysipelotrichaceae bacterium]